jgi:hypothetical protein
MGVELATGTVVESSGEGGGDLRHAAVEATATKRARRGARRITRAV